MLLLAAGHLTSGTAVGVDLWRRTDQSGNSPEAARRNAEAEGVSGNVELSTGDMTALPFQDASFDLILSNLAVHNVKPKSQRRAVIAEAVRVLRPGGKLWGKGYAFRGAQRFKGITGGFRHRREVTSGGFVERSNSARQVTLAQAH